MLIDKEDPRSRAKLLEVLLSGGIAIAPCDTIYGFLGRVPDAEGRIRAAKGRAEAKPFLILLGDPSETALFSDEPLPESLLRYWPGPLSIVIPSKLGGTVCLRNPDDPYLLEILKACGFPLYSTSVNRSGQPPMNEVGAICAEFGREVDLIVDGGDLGSALPSTILDIASKPWRILRQGSLVIPGIG